MTKRKTDFERWRDSLTPDWFANHFRNSGCDGCPLKWKCMEEGGTCEDMFREYDKQRDEEEKED